MKCVMRILLLFLLRGNFFWKLGFHCIRVALFELSPLTLMVFSGAEEFYAVRLTRLVVLSKTMYIVPVALRYVFVDDDKFDVEMKGDDYTEKKSLDMLCKSLRKEIEIQGNTWKQGGKPTQLLKCSVN